MFKKTILLLIFIFIMMVVVACSPLIKSPFVTTQNINTPLSPTLPKVSTLPLKAITPTPTDSYLRSVSGSIGVMSGGQENGIGLLNIESGEIQNLSPDSGVASFSWSPDGKQVAFDGVNQSSSSLASHIFVIKVDHNELKQLTSNNQSEYGLDWSPDGTQIAYVYENNGAYSDLALFRLSDSVSRQITSTKGAEIAPSFSPDGKTLAYVYIEDFSALVVKPQLMLMDIKSRQSRQIPLNVPVIGQRVSWSPDGKTIAFVSGTFDNDCGDIYLVAVDGSSLVHLPELMSCAKQVVWSPDGKYFAFVAVNKKPKGNISNWGWQIYLMASDGTNVVQVTHKKDWIIRDIDWVLIE